MEKLADLSAFESLGQTASDMSMFCNNFTVCDQLQREDEADEFAHHLFALTDALKTQQDEQSRALANLEGAKAHARISRMTIESARQQLDEAFVNGMPPQAFQRILGILQNGLTAANTAAGSSGQWEPDEGVKTSLQWLRSTWESRKE